ncbi:RNA-guided endonuclease InsQ/TnpB family protein [Bifidobacterium choerinum]|uniref:RNA-guided endonuclease InsQ/TnpB family protein n=1 Tax=Bifidobacterium choerinum TaxID=35760 RepID=UPI003F902E24
MGCSRLVRNKALDYRTKAWTQEHRRVSYLDTSKLLTGWKKDPELAFLKEVSSVALQQSLRHLETGFVNFYNKRAGYPKFHSKKNGGSASFMGTAFRWDGKSLRLAKMSEPLHVVWSRTLPRKARPSSVTVTLDPAGRWFVSILVREAIPCLPACDKTVGIDLGVKDFAILSDGTKIPNQHFAERNQKRLKRAQKALSRKQPGSRNRRKAALRVARINAQTRDRRRDFLHKLSTRIIRENQTIVLEDLSVRGISRRVRAVEAPDTGRYLCNGQARKRGLNRSILDQGWRELRGMLEYKARWYGRDVVVIDRFYPSTQLCSACGAKTGPRTLDVRRWTCPECGMRHDRDVNAARNILAAGLAVRACGDSRTRKTAEQLASVRLSGKQETRPVRNGILRL